MISWQSIMSVFNTKGTLLKWLKTLDQSLKDGVLESVSVNSVSEGVITLSFNFADGSVITTPQIDIPQGAQGPQGLPGTNGANGESFNPRGEWVADNEYHPFDYVTYNGSSYLCTETIIDGTDAPPLDTAHWQLVAEKGDQGEPGTSPTVNIIEYAEQLPTASGTSPNFVQTPDGTLYRKKAVEGGGLVGTVYTFKDDIATLITSSNTFNLSFTSNNGTSYSSIKVKKSTWAASMSYDDTAVWGSPAAADADYYGWKTSGNYKEITITDISSLTNVDEFVSFMDSVATSTGDGGGSVTYSYVALADAV